MEGRPSFTSFLTSSLRSSFKSSGRHPRDSEENGAKGSYERRRQQVRRAQKKHRERKENYVVALEEEIQCLRATVRNIQLENTILRNALDLHGITALTNYSPPVPGNDTARVTLSGPPGPHQFLQVQTHDFHAFPAPVQGTKNAISSRNAAQLLGDAVGQQIGIGNEQYATPTIGTRHPCQLSSPPASSIGALDSEFAGFHFVLTLEHPCLQHTGHPSISSGMSGHALTLNAAALACAPSCIRPDEVWSVPTSSLERLLDLSAGLGMEPGEITPIQAWQCLREHPDFAILTPERLQELISKLSNEVKCRGFGAAMNEKRFNALLRQAFQTLNG